MGSLRERNERTRILRVLPAIHGWKVHLDGAGLPMSIHQTRDDAIAQARALASGDDEVVVHDDDGCVVSWYPWSLRMRVA